MGKLYKFRKFWVQRELLSGLGKSGKDLGSGQFSSLTCNPKPPQHGKDRRVRILKKKKKKVHVTQEVTVTSILQGALYLMKKESNG